MYSGLKTDHVRNFCMVFSGHMDKSTQFSSRGRKKPMRGLKTQKKKAYKFLRKNTNSAPMQLSYALPALYL